MNLGIPPAIQPGLEEGFDLLILGEEIGPPLIFD
jgi:hypothetical protein